LQQKCSFEKNKGMKKLWMKIETQLKNDAQKPLSEAKKMKQKKTTHIQLNLKANKFYPNLR